MLVSELDLWDFIPQQDFDWFYFSSFILFHNVCIKSDTPEHLIFFNFQIFVFNIIFAVKISYQ